MILYTSQAVASKLFNVTTTGFTNNHRIKNSIQIYLRSRVGTIDSNESPSSFKTVANQTHTTLKVNSCLHRIFLSIFSLNNPGDRYTN